MKAGIVGFGKMGMLHGALLNKIEGVEVAAIVDTSKILVSAFHSLLPKIKCFTSYDRMFEEMEIDAVVIATSTFSHVPLALKAVDKNKHFFIEKPLSNSYENALSLEKALGGKPLVSMVGFHMRYMPTFMKGKELLARGVIGKVRDVSAEYYVSDIFSPQKGWRYNPAMSGGGVVIDFAIHLLDIMHWYFGEAATVKADIKRLFSKQVEDEVTAEIGFNDGLTAKIVSSWSVAGYRLPYCALRMLGDTGSMTVTDHNVVISDKSGSVIQRHNMPDLYTGYYFDIAGSHYSLQMEAFAQAIKTKKRFSNLKDATYAQKLVAAIYNSASKGSAVAIREGI